MKSKLLLFSLVVFLAASLVGGTSAYFSAKAEAPVSEFTAGTVMIEAGQAVYYSDGKDSMNVNPGDAFKKCIKVTNTGSKAIELRLADFEFDLGIDWEYICENFEALCFSEVIDGDNPRWMDCEALKMEVNTALDAQWNEYKVTHPGYAEGEPLPNNPFDSEGKLINPLMAAPTPISGWIMKYVEGETVFFYADGPLAPGESTTLCTVLLFDGPWMGNLWQAAEFTMSGNFQAVQASNDAPQGVWGEGTWDNYQEVSEKDTPRLQLEATFGEAYANYFYENDTFIYAYLCEMENGNGWYEKEETAFGGEEEGAGAAWWFYFDMTGAPTQPITVGQTTEMGEVTVEVNRNTFDRLEIKIVFDEYWELQSDSEAVKIGGYDEVPTSRPAQYNLYKGDDLEVVLLSPPEFRVDFPYYVIHLDVLYYGP